MPYQKLNAYRSMWLFVFFDLPVTTKSGRKKASKFRENLLKDGFTMLQYSIYIRACGSSESGDVHTERIKNLTPKKGHVSILRVTDKQFSNIINIRQEYTQALASVPRQLELF